MLEITTFMDGVFIQRHATSYMINDSGGRFSDFYPASHSLNKHSLYLCKRNLSLQKNQKDIPV